MGGSRLDALGSVAVSPQSSPATLPPLLSFTRILRDALAAAPFCAASLASRRPNCTVGLLGGCSGGVLAVDAAAAVRAASGDCERGRACRGDGSIGKDSRGNGGSGGGSGGGGSGEAAAFANAARGASPSAGTGVGVACCRRAFLGPRLSLDGARTAADAAAGAGDDAAAVVATGKVKPASVDCPAALRRLPLPPSSITDRSGAHTMEFARSSASKRASITAIHISPCSVRTREHL